MKSRSALHIPTTINATTLLAATRTIAAPQRGHRDAMTTGQARVAALGFLGVLAAVFLAVAIVAPVLGSELGVTVLGLVAVAAVARYHDRRRTRR